MMQGVSPDPLHPRAYPSTEEFTKQVQDLGINNDTHVVVYDRSEGKCGFFIGGRVWLMFRVSKYSKRFEVDHMNYVEICMQWVWFDGDVGDWSVNGST